MKKYTYMRLLLVIVSGTISVILTRILVLHTGIIPNSWVSYVIVGGLVTYFSIQQYDRFLKVRRIRAERELNILKDITYRRYLYYEDENKEDDYD